MLPSLPIPSAGWMSASSTLEGMWLCWHGAQPELLPKIAIKNAFNAFKNDFFRNEK